MKFLIIKVFPNLFVNFLSLVSVIYLVYHYQSNRAIESHPESGNLKKIGEVEFEDKDCFQCER